MFLRISSLISPSGSLQEYYVVLLFCDHICTELEEQFSSLADTATRLLRLIPYLLSENIDIGDAVAAVC